MDSKDRDMLIRVEEKLKSAHQNQLTIIEDLRNIFKRLEHNSKTITTFSGELKGHLDSSKIVWSNCQKQNSEIERRIKDLEDKIEVTDDEITKEREQRTQAVTNERETRVKEFKERETFERETKTGIKVITWLFVILTSIATLISAVTAVAVFLFK